MTHIVQKLGMAGLAGSGIALLLCALPGALGAQAFGTTTVQGTVYLASGAPASGSLQLSWPAFTTAANQAVAAGRLNAAIGADGFVSVKLAPNAGATPAGLYYTAVYHLSDGATSTEYWVVPAAAQASLAAVRATVMPAAQAVQAVSKTYVDQTVAQAIGSQLTASGGNLTGPLYLNGDPSAPTQAATKRYVDNQLGQALSVNGGAATGALTALQLGAAYQADQFVPGGDFGAKLQACINALNGTYGGTCDARNFSGTLAMASNVTIGKANATVNLPCATIATASQIVVTAGTRNVTLHGCASRGTTAASGNQGGTVFLYSGSAAMIQAGDSTYAANTLGFHLDNVVINTTPATAATAQAIALWRAQELHLESLYLLGNANQTGITLDGTGNYTGGTLTDVEVSGYQTAINGIGHQVANPAPTDWVNASTFVRLHIACPTSNGNPIAGTTGINLQQGDGNMITGGDVEGCATALHLGPNAQNNTIVGLRNENSTYQVVADAGSAYNNWMTGGTMFTGKLTDNGTRNSFLDTFHRSFNGLNGDWYGSQQDATVINHYRLGIGSGNERGLQERYQTDLGYRWTTGLSDATAGEQFYQVLDELNNVNRLSIGQYNSAQSGTNNQTVINAAGTGAIVLNGSNNAGSGGVVFGSGGPASTTVATVDNAGNAQFTGTLRVGGVTTFSGSPSVKNQADAEIDYLLQAGATAPQKESVVYKDWNGASQWYLVKDASNNWALNSAVGGVDSFKAYQSTNSGDTYIDAANNTGVVRVNYEPGSGSAFNVYGGSSSSLYASFNGTTGIKFPGLASGSGKNCVQIDNAGYLSNTGAACAGNSVGAGTTGQIAYYPSNGSALSGVASVPISAGGTGATTAAGALASLGGLALTGGTLSGDLSGANATFSGQVQAQNVSAQSVALGSDQPSGHQAASANAAVLTYSVRAYGAVGDAKSNISNSSGTFYFTGTMSAGSNTMSLSLYGAGMPVAGQWISVQNPTAQPFADVPYTALSNWSTNNVAQIVSVNGSNVTLSKAALNSFSGGVTFGTDNATLSGLGAFNGCGAAAYTLTGGGACEVPAGNFGFFTAPYYILPTAQDDGGYGTNAGGSGASLSPVLGSGATAGQIVSVTINNGGAHYTPNSQNQVSISGGCNGVYACGQAYVLANADSSGVIRSATVVHGGFGFVSAPTLAVQALGGDGAAATVTLNGGSLNVPVVTAGGGGYPVSSSSAQPWYALQGTSGCNTLSSGAGRPTYVATGNATSNASGQIVSMTITTNASGCTSAPVIVFGPYACPDGSGGWQQCSNMAPLAPQKVPVHVYTGTSVSWTGHASSRGGGTNLTGSWDLKSVNSNQPALLGGVYAYYDVKNLILNGANIGAMWPMNANYGLIQDVTFNTNWGMYTWATDLGFKVDGLTFSGCASWVNGGMWAHRSDWASGGGGFFDATSVKDVISRLSNTYTANCQNLDNWFDQNIWLSSASAYNTDFMEAPKFPAAASQRQTGANFTLPQTANSHADPGISGWGMLILTRDNRGTGAATVEHLDVKQTFRGLFCCNIGSMKFWNAGSEGMSPLTGTNDPYRTATSLEGAMKFVECSTAFPGGQASVDTVSYSGSSAFNRVLWSINSQGDPKCVSWRGNGGGGANAQAAQNMNLTSPESFPQGISVGDAGVNSSNYPITLKGPFGTSNLNAVTAKIQAASGGGSLYASSNGGSSYADALDWYTGSVNANVGLYAKSGFYSCASGTAYCASLTFSGTGNRAVNLPDANSTTVQGAGGATSGQVVQYIDTNGAQHYTPASTYTAAQIAALFTGCSGAMYLGADGACHNSTYTLPAATTSTLGGMKCDGSTITCGADGTITSVSGSGAGIVASSAGTSNGSANVAMLSYSTPPGAGHMYRMCAHVDVATAATAGTFTTYEIYYTSGHQVGGFWVGTTSATGWAYKDGCWNGGTLFADGGTTVSLQLQFSGIAGSPVFNYAATLELLK
ncbi:hypothetical protein DYQ86_26645 [Acidobacteria bacterium AB60]|nr:hypothetical protein DYQ86_26645 [Acidobacteria bacterium AB60]